VIVIIAGQLLQPGQLLIIYDTRSTAEHKVRARSLINCVTGDCNVRNVTVTERKFPATNRFTPKVTIFKLYSRNITAL